MAWSDVAKAPIDHEIRSDQLSCHRPDADRILAILVVGSAVTVPCTFFLGFIVVVKCISKFAYSRPIVSNGTRGCLIRRPLRI